MSHTFVHNIIWIFVGYYLLVSVIFSTYGQKSGLTSSCAQYWIWTQHLLRIGLCRHLWYWVQKYECMGFKCRTHWLFLQITCFLSFVSQPISWVINLESPSRVLIKAHVSEREQRQGSKLVLLSFFLRSISCPKSKQMFFLAHNYKVYWKEHFLKNID